MRKKLKQLYSGSQQLVLSQQERQEMLDVVQSRIRLLREQGVNRQISHQVIRPKYLRFITHKLMPIVLILAVMVAGGVSVAAEQSLPGDTFYPVKIAINEEVRAATIFSAEAKADWSARRVERRLEEAQLLLTQNQLDNNAQMIVAQRFETQAQATAEKIAKLQAKGNTQAAAAISSHFETILAAHEEVIARLAIATSSQEEVKPLLKTVNSIRQQASQKRIETEAAARAELKNSSEAEIQTNQLLNNVEVLQNRLRANLHKVADTVESDIEAQISAGVDAADQAIAESRSQIQAHAYAEAADKLHETQRSLDRAQIILDRFDNLKIKIQADNSTRAEAENQNNDTPEKNTQSSTSSLELDAAGEAEIEMENTNDRPNQEEINLNINARTQISL